MSSEPDVYTDLNGSPRLLHFRRRQVTSCIVRPYRDPINIPSYHARSNGLPCKDTYYSPELVSRSSLHELHLIQEHAQVYLSPVHPPSPALDVFLLNYRGHRTEEYTEILEKLLRETHQPRGDMQRDLISALNVSKALLVVGD